jgi:hypothetical protein
VAYSADDNSMVLKIEQCSIIAHAKPETRFIARKALYIPLQIFLHSLQLCKNTP